ncbi:hypothetical protein G7046_g276 [Stylonectria norvegica]|nr:hypothetical protein G7046_g276 [Stylonectria norvegica]
MATSLKSSSALNDIFAHLSSELLALVFEQLRHIDLEALQSLRLVSRRFNAIATPIFYHILTLNDSIVAPDAEQRYQTVFQHISNYTHHVVVPSYLDPSGINRILVRIRRLDSVRWQFTDSNFDITVRWKPSDLLKSDQTRYRNTKLYVDDLPLRDFGSHLNDDYIRAIPGELLTSLTLASPSPALTARLGSLKLLLLRSPKLKTLHYDDRGQGTNFSFDENERLPAFTNLRIKSYNWNHTAEQVRKHWDFSRIRSLELISVPIFNFLRSVSFDDLTNLHTLHIEDFSAHLSDMREEATGGLYLLVKNYIRTLEVLDITCHTQIFPLDAISAHRDTLRVLRLRDHAGFWEEGRRCPTLHGGDLAVLGRQLGHVQSLELDMDIRLCDPPEFLRAVCEFSALHTLTLNIQTVVHALDVVPEGTDPDYSAAMQTFQLLIQAKQQKTPQVPWKRITLKVGDWRPVMVRRLGSAWQRHNENGIYAERCFVLEREEGRFDVREEMCLENSSRRTTPDRTTSGISES